MPMENLSKNAVDTTAKVVLTNEKISVDVACTKFDWGNRVEEILMNEKFNLIPICALLLGSFC
jgi:hypothetical protein